MPTRLLLVMLPIFACDSTALSRDDPTAIQVELDRPYLEGDATVRAAVLTVTDVDDPNDLAGDPLSWTVLDWDFGPDLALEAWSFRSNFVLDLTIRRFPNARIGTHELLLSLRNTYGVFVARGEFFVFP